MTESARLRFVARFAVLVFYASMAVGAASACSVCFGDPDDPQSHGMNMAILTLLGVTGGVLATVVAFAVRVALRIRRAELAAGQAGDSA